MDNEAFASLVQQHRATTTKRIAREAVEEEFLLRRKKRKGAKEGYSSDEEEADEDSGDDVDDEKGKNETKKGEDRRKRSEKSKKSDEVKYRDRAKERREGKDNVDYQRVSVQLPHETTTETTAEYARDMTKYLGGDEAHTHLVKGLDLALADKVRREEMGKTRTDHDEEDLDVTLDTALSQQQQKSSAQDLGSTNTKAMTEQNTLLLPHKPKSILGVEMLSYLSSRCQLPLHGQHRSLQQQTQKQQQSVSQNSLVQAKFRGIDDTTYVFSLTANLYDFSRAWEIPEEKIRSLDTPALDDGRENLDGVAELGSSLDRNMLERIKLAFLPFHCTAILNKDGHVLDEEKDIRRKNRIDKKSTSENSDEVQQRVLVQDIANDGGRDDTTQNNERTVDCNSFSGKQHQTPRDNESSDEDIFGDVVGSYEPTAVDTSNNMNKTVPITNLMDEPVEHKKMEKFKIFDAPLTTDGPDEEKRYGEEAVRFDKKEEQASPPLPSAYKNVSSSSRFKHRSKQNKIGIIDRDILGGRPERSNFVQTATKNNNHGGLSTSTYNGGYGEEMDTDFAGMADMEDDEEMEEKETKHSAVVSRGKKKRRTK